MPFNPEKLQKFLAAKGAAIASSQTGGKGTIRRKHKAVRKNTTQDDKRLKSALQKLNVRDIPAIEEVNLFKDDGHVIHISNPKGALRLLTAQASYAMLLFYSASLDRWQHLRRQWQR